MVDTIKAQNYFDAATALFGVASSLQRAQSNLADELSGTEGMAGKDDRGKEFGSAYDEQAGQIESFGRDLISAVQNYGRVLRQAGINHVSAETNSNINGGASPPAPPADPGESIAPCINIPRASGGNSDGLVDDVSLLEQVGIPIPDGDTDKLRKAESAWGKLASDQSAGFIGKISDVAAKFDELNGDEIDYIVEDLQELDSLAQDYTGLAGALKQACANHLDYLTDLRNQLKDLLESLAIDLAVTATIGVVSSLVSFGGGAAIAAGKAAATVARYAVKVKDLIESVKRFKAFQKFADLFKGAELSKKNEKLVRFLQMELRDARTQGARNNLKGRIGELKAGIEPNAPKARIEINGRVRVPDKLDEVAGELTEVKNVNSLGPTQQIRDMFDYATQNGYNMRIVVDERTEITGPLQDLISRSGGRLRIDKLALN